MRLRNHGSRKGVWRLLISEKELARVLEKRKKGHIRKVRDILFNQHAMRCDHPLVFPGRPRFKPWSDLCLRLVKIIEYKGLVLQYHQ